MQAPSLALKAAQKSHKHLGAPRTNVSYEEAARQLTIVPTEIKADPEDLSVRQEQNPSHQHAHRVSHQIPHWYNSLAITRDRRHKNSL